jgi:hypothetical protein
VIGKIVAQNIENDSDEATIELADAHFTDFCRGQIRAWRSGE